MKKRFSGTVAGSLSASKPLFHTQRLCRETIRGRCNPQIIPRPTVSAGWQQTFNWWAGHFAPPNNKSASV